MSSTRAPRPTAQPQLRFNIAYSSWELIWSHVHRVLVVNLGIVVTNLPLLAALTVCHRPWHYPLFFGPLLLLAGPSIAAAFAFMNQAGEEGQVTLRVFLRAYARLFRPALRISGVTLLTVVAAVVDAVALRWTAIGPAVVPMAAVVAFLAVLSGTVALAHPVAVDEAGFKALILVPYAVVRHWLPSLLNLALIAVGLLLINQAPLLGMAVLPGCVLFVLWRNCLSSTVIPPRAEQGCDQSRVRSRRQPVQPTHTSEHGSRDGSSPADPSQSHELLEWECLSRIASR